MCKSYSSSHFLWSFFSGHVQVPSCSPAVQARLWGPPDAGKNKSWGPRAMGVWSNLSRRLPHPPVQHQPPLPGQQWDPQGTDSGFIPPVPTFCTSEGSSQHLELLCPMGRHWGPSVPRRSFHSSDRRKWTHRHEFPISPPQCTSPAYGPALCLAQQCCQ